MAAEFAPVVLEGRWVRLEPLAQAHYTGLCAAGADPAIWAWYHAPYDTPERMRAFVDEALRLQQQGQALPFVQIDRATGAVAGSTRFLNIERAHRRAEIGFTWLHPRFQRTALNTEAKYLLLRHAFEALALNRVEFKTDSLNAKSRAALARIGAVEEGTFRNHMVTHGGRIRHSVYFSITSGEWLSVKRRLEARLGSESFGRPVAGVTEAVGGK